MNFQYSFDYCNYNGIKGDDKSLSIYEGDWRSGGDVITREFALAHQHEADRHTYEAAVKYLKSHANNPDAIIEKLNQCEWVKQMNEADEAERLGSIYIFKTRVKKSWSNITYNFNYVGDTEEEAEDKYWELKGNDDDMSCSYCCPACGFQTPEEAFWSSDFKEFNPLPSCPKCGIKLKA